MRDAIVTEARKWLGTPYHHQGRVLGAGVDCLGLVAEVAKALGLCDHDAHDYGRVPEGDRLIAELREHAGREIRAADAQPGDILLFRFLRQPRHVAIKTGIGMIHAYAQAGKVVEHRLDDRWMKQCVCAFEFPGVSNG
jgi:NlpC/P60 family putative phage cell wall peptidase